MFFVIPKHPLEHISVIVPDCSVTVAVVIFPPAFKLLLVALVD
jgi:hypothetical protein